MTKCLHMPGGGIACVPDSVGQSVIVNGKPVYFDFDENFGPLVTGPKGEERKQPGASSPFWPAFNVWLKDWTEKKQIADAMRVPRVPTRDERLDRSAANLVHKDKS